MQVAKPGDDRRSRRKLGRSEGCKNESNSRRQPEKAHSGNRTTMPVFSGLIMYAITSLFSFLYGVAIVKVY